MNNILERIMKIWYFENTHRDESNDILYDIIYLCILVEKYGQSKLGQNYTFLNGSSITGRREYHLLAFSYNKTDHFNYLTIEQYFILLCIFPINFHSLFLCLRNLNFRKKLQIKTNLSVISNFPFSNIHLELSTWATQPV